MGYKLYIINPISHQKQYILTTNLHKNHDANRKIHKRNKRIRELIKPVIDEHYPSKANRKTISLHDFMTFNSCICTSMEL
ncbi:hypothetical protein KKP97_02920 [Methanothermococcus sp. SCGC AD-155-C09]|nr:hypothetical protein [Methanothermococcus sp. SCGC AD-155-C09]